MFGQGQPQKTQPICFCGDKSHHWWHSVVGGGGQLGSISDRSVTGRRGQLHTLKTAKYETRVCECARAPARVCACVYGWYIERGLTLIQGISWRWIRGHLLFAAESCWTTVSYVNWPFVQCAKWHQHICEMRGTSSHSGAAHTARGSTKCVSFARWANSLCYHIIAAVLGEASSPRSQLLGTSPIKPDVLLSNQWLLNHDGSFHSSTNHGPAGHSWAPP